MIREATGLTQVAAAKMLGISVVYLCNLEHGDKLPSLRLIDRISKAWGINPYVLAWCLDNAC
jgi:transcriptional regulator with XRE-family HTH domain